MKDKINHSKSIMQKMNNKFNLLIIILFLAGCSADKVEQPHSHGPEALAYTVYSENSEIFVEFKPMVVGAPVRFAAHFTLLGETFRPLTKGTVTVSLIVNGKGIQQSASQPSVPGIYRLALTPKIAGKGTLIFDIVTDSLKDRIVINNIEVFPDEKTMLSQQVEQEASNEITFLKEQAWKMEFANVPVRKSAFISIIKTSGQILSAPGDEIVINAMASGQIHFTDRAAIIGSEVSENTELFTIADGGFSSGNLDALYQNAKVEFERSKAEYHRATELVKDKIISEKEFLKAKSEYEVRRVAYNSVSRDYSSKGRSIRAGINGYVKDVLVKEGQFVESGTPLLRISMNKKLVLQAQLALSYFDKISAIKSANFKLPGSNRILNTDQLNGKIISVGKSALQSAPFIAVSFGFDNTEKLIPGSIVEVFLKSTPVPDVLAIPLSSIMEEQGLFYVYIQTAGESFQKREVVVGNSDGESVQILNGIVEGERVVSKGAYQIKLAQASGKMPAHGHEH